MPFTIGTAYSGSNQSPAYTQNFIPEIWSAKLIEKFYDATVLAAISNTNYEGEIKKHGDRVYMRQRPTVTIRDYTVNQDLLVDRPSASVLQLNIDKGKYFNLHLDDVMRMQMDVDLMNQWSMDASEQFKIAIDQDILGVRSGTGGAAGILNSAAAANRGATAGRITAGINLGVAGTPVLLTRANIMDYIILLGQVLDEQNVPETGRWIILPAWMASLLKRSDLRDAALTGDGVSVARNGKLGTIDRFTIYTSNLLPTSTTDGIAGNDSDAATYIYAGHPNAITFASQFTELDVLKSERTFGQLMRGLQVYGYSVPDPTCLAQLYARPDATANSPV